MIGVPELSEVIEVFLSYAHEDEKLREKLDSHLSSLVSNGVITSWHDRKILPGKDWATEIDEHIQIAQIILPLVSSDFIASRYCQGVEMKTALERMKADEAQVIPVFLREVHLAKKEPIRGLQSLPKDAKPVTSWSNRDKAFANVASGIEEAVDMLILNNQRRAAKALLDLGGEGKGAQLADALQRKIEEDAKKQQVDRWRILRETQTKIVEIQQHIAANPSASSDQTDRMFRKWSEYIRS